MCALQSISNSSQSFLEFFLWWMLTSKFAHTATNRIEQAYWPFTFYLSVYATLP